MSGFGQGTAHRGLGGVELLTTESPVPASRDILLKDEPHLREAFAKIGELLAALEPREQRQDLQGFGSVVVDLSLGKHVRLTLTGNVTRIVVANWLAAPLVNRFELEIVNPAAFAIDLSFAGWPDGEAPKIPANSRNRLSFVSTDNGATVDGRVIALNYGSLASSIVDAGVAEVGRPVLTVQK